MTETAFAFAPSCNWAEWETGQWEADCGLIWELNGPCTTPTGHGMNFCPGCGRRLVEHPYVEPAVEDGEEGA